MQFPFGWESWGLDAKLQSILFAASGCWQDPEAVGLVVWGSLGLQHTAVCSVEGLPNLFSFISSAREFVLFYPPRVKPWIKSPVGTDMPTLLLSKMNTDHIPVLNHTLFSLHVRMQSIVQWLLLLRQVVGVSPRQGDFHVNSFLQTCPLVSTLHETVDVTEIMASATVPMRASNEGEEDYCPCKQ